MHRTPHIQKSIQLGLPALLCFAGLAVAALTTSTPAAADEPVRAPANLVVTSPRICTALALYRVAGLPEAERRAKIRAALDSYASSSASVDCASGVAQALTHDFNVVRWDLALAVVDSVPPSPIPVPPDACGRANPPAPLSSASTSPVVVRSQCVTFSVSAREAAR